MRTGDLDAVIVVPRGLGAVVADRVSGRPPRRPLALDVYTDPSQTTQSQTITPDRGPGGRRDQPGRRAARRPCSSMAVAVGADPGRSARAAYFVPSILAMALMQLGIFSAIPLVEQRQKLILKRLSATPLRRWNLVGSNILMRLLIAVRPGGAHRRHRRRCCSA